jgi:hypothetical protein
MTNPKKKHRRSRRRSASRNPFVSRSKRRSKANRGGFRRRRHNPNIGGFSGTELLKLGLGAAGGAIGARYVTQAVLGEKNTGAMGYGANALAAIGLAWLAAKYAGKDIAAGVAAGGLSAVVLRIWSERVSGTSPAAMSGYLGDVDFSSDGLGAYIESGFPLPTVSTQNGNYLTVAAPGGQLVHAASASNAPQNSATQSRQDAGLTRFAARF